MTLIDQLRDVGCNREPFTPDHAKCICRLTNEAADEIERLRAEVQNLRDNLSSEVEVAVAQIGDVNVTAERERCAKIADLYASQARPLGDENVGECPLTAYFDGQKIVAENISHDIRKGL